MQINKKKTPLSVVEGCSRLIDLFIPLKYKYEDVIEINFDRPNDLIYITDIEESEFRFIISNPTLDKQNKFSVSIVRVPENEQTIKANVIPSGEEAVMAHFKYWLNLINWYNNAKLSESDFYTRQAEKEFYDEFKIQSEEANPIALSTDSQIKVYYLLEQMQQRLENFKTTIPEAQKVIEEAETLKNTLQELPQVAVAKRVAKLMSRVKKLGIKVLLDVVDVA